MNINSIAPLICIAALLHSAPALAAEPQYFGAKDCQIRVIDTYTNYKAIWKGPCKDGFAEGQGLLIMKHEGKELSRYEGGMQRGLRQGPGYVSYASGDQFEGSFKDSRRDGKGVYLSADGDEIQGDWKDGKLDGIATATYATGGRYDGSWKDNEFHGRGRAVYIGGQVIEGNFDMGAAPGLTVPDIAPDQGSYSLNDHTPPTGSRMRRPQETGSTVGVPYDKSYAEMTPAQQQSVRREYPMLHPDDVPPYPVKGTKGMSEWISKAQAVGTGIGLLSLQVMVGSDGKATSVKIIATPDPDLGQAAVRIMMGETFTPGTCAGKPCAMMYPTRYRFR